MTGHENLPIVNLDVFLNPQSNENIVREECRKAADALITFGAMFVHDSRVDMRDNDTYLDMLEDYFSRSKSDILKDERPDMSWQVGITPEFTNRSRCAIEETCVDIVDRLEPQERPVDVSERPRDPQWRYFWRVGRKLPYETQYPKLNPVNTIPAAEQFHDRWEPTMNKWGLTLRDAAEAASQMLAIGFDCPTEMFNGGKYGPHILGPTATDMNIYDTKDTILGGFHTDMNFLTVHGPSRYPSLHIWARNTGKRITPQFPTNGQYLLVQAGKQLQHLTGGLIEAGYHEVVVNDGTLKAIEHHKTSFPDRPLWRISSTCFYHLASDYELCAIPALAERAKTLGVNLINDDHNPIRVGDYIYKKIGVSLSANDHIGA